MRYMYIYKAETKGNREVKYSGASDILCNMETVDDWGNKESCVIR